VISGIEMKTFLYLESGSVYSLTLLHFLVISVRKKGKLFADMGDIRFFM